MVNCLCKIDENRFASCSDDKLILIWDTNNGLLLDVLTGHKASIKSLISIQYKQFKLLISSSLDHTIKVECYIIIIIYRYSSTMYLHFNST